MPIVACWSHPRRFVFFRTVPAKYVSALAQIPRRPSRTDLRADPTPGAGTAHCRPRRRGGLYRTRNGAGPARHDRRRRPRPARRESPRHGNVDGGTWARRARLRRQAPDEGRNCVPGAKSQRDGCPGPRLAVAAADHGRGSGKLRRNLRDIAGVPADPRHLPAHRHRLLNLRGLGYWCDGGGPQDPPRGHSPPGSSGHAVRHARHRRPAAPAAPPGSNS
ncbi:hypothetical protein D9M72_372450 [compost metagenome]